MAATQTVYGDEVRANPMPTTLDAKEAEVGLWSRTFGSRTILK
jgi:hypothetical protein